MKRVVITGATSMLGIALIKRLLNSNVEKVYAVVRTYNQQQRENKRSRIPIDSRVQLIECNMNDYGKLATLINEKCDVFYHMTWPRTATYEEDIEDILLKCDAIKCVAEAVNAAHILGCSKFIGAGSQSEYGVPSDGNYVSGMECRPIRMDGVAHLAAGQMAKLLAERLGMICVWMRIFSVYGIYDRNNSLISSTIENLIEGRHCAFTKAEQIWDYVHADDVAEAFYLVGEKVEKNIVYNIASGEKRPLKEYIETIRDVVSQKAELGFGEIEYPTNPIMEMSVDILDLVTDTGWTPQICFREGIEQIYKMRLLEGEMADAGKTGKTS